MPRGIYRKAMDSGQENLDKFLGELELTIMELLWEQSPATVLEVRSALANERELAYTTVMTVMTRLAEKGLLTRRKKGRAYVYWPNKSREELKASLAGKVVRALLADFGQIAVSQFVYELEEIDPDMLAKLREFAGEDDDDGVDEND